MELIRRTVLVLGATALALAALEGACRLVVRPSKRSAGRLFGSELPPVRLIPPAPPHHTPRPAAIRTDDLTGLVRDDPVLGYAPRERAVSTNGWWQSNGIDLRVRMPDELFKDHHHLNPRGAATFADALGREALVPRRTRHRPDRGDP